MMTTEKYSAFMPGWFIVETAPQLKSLLESQCNLVTIDDVQADKSAGKDVQVGFFYDSVTAKTLTDYKEQGLLPDLKLMINHGVGTNHFPFAKMKELGIRCTNTPDVLSDGTADMGFALMMSSGRRLKEGVSRIQATNNKQLFGELFLGQDICYSSLGIVGMGSIGYKVAERAKAFKMKIHYHNRNRRSESDESAVGVTYHAKLEDMLPQCDFVMLTCSLTPSTKHMFGKEQFKIMKNTAHLVNVARGMVVDTDALYEALTTGEIAAAALDVTDPEPMPHDHPLQKLDNVIISPHWASATVQTRAKMIQLMVDNGKALIEGRQLLTEVVSHESLSTQVKF